MLFRSVVAPLCALVCSASALAQGDVYLPFYGVFGTGSPELSSTIGTADIVRCDSPGRIDGATAPGPLEVRGAAAALGFPSSVIPPQNVKIGSMAYGNDVFPPWGPKSPLPNILDKRWTTVWYAVSADTTIEWQGSPVLPLPNFPVSGQVFAARFRMTRDELTNLESFEPDGIAPEAGSPGIVVGSASTTIQAMATEPRDAANGGIPVYFTLTADTCDLLNASGTEPYHSARPCDIWFASGVGPPVIAFHGVAAGLQPDDEIGSLAISNAGACVFSLAAGSPSSNAPDGLRLPNPYDDQCEGLTVDPNTLLGFVPSTAQAWDSQIVPPSGYAFDSLFVWLTPELLGLDPANGSTSDTLNVITIGDPPQPEGNGGTLPLRGVDGGGAQQRLCVFAQGVAGDGGGVFPVRVRTGTPIKLQAKLQGTPFGSASPPAQLVDWTLFIRPGRANEHTYAEVDWPGGSMPLFPMYFDPFVMPAQPLFGTLPYLNYYLGTAGQLPSGTLNHLTWLTSGLPTGSYTLQLVALTAPPAGGAPTKCWSSNCVQLEVKPVGAHVFMAP